MTPSPANFPGEPRRRSILEYLVGILGSLIAVTLSSAGAGYFLSPAFQRKEEGWVDLGRSDAFKPGAPSKVEFVERKRDAWAVTEKRSSAWVVTTDGKNFTVFDPRCPHLGCPYRWDVKDKRFLCPCHTASFALTGRVLGGPAPRPLDRYETKVEQKRLLIVPQPLRQEPKASAGDRTPEDPARKT